MRHFHRSHRRAQVDYGPLLAQSFQHVKTAGALGRVIETGRARLAFGAALFALCFAVLAGRLIDVAVMAPESGPLAGAAADDARLVGTRADIADRNGTLIATDLPTASLYADPALVLDPDEAAAKLAAVLPELGYSSLLAKLSSERRFVWIKRHLTPKQQYEVNGLGLPGLAFLNDERRVYPQGPLFAHVLGFTGIDNHGLTGLERALDRRLSAETTGARPEPLALSLDLGVQHVLREELVCAMDEFDALGAAGLVLDARTGEVLALVSLPDFDPNQPGTPSEDAQFDRVTLGVYEMGSTFKIFTAAMALDSGRVHIDDGYDASQPIKIARFTITDYHPQNRYLTVPEIIVYSSNIGAAKMALDVGTDLQKAYLRRFGLLTPATIELPEVGPPLAPDPWREINTMTIAFGHGIAVSPLQLANATAAMVNGGILRPATLIKHEGDGPVPGERVIGEETSHYMRALLRLVVEQGTGKNAEAPGYLVGGKTGTAEKTLAGRYERNALLSTFVGAFPMNEPRYVVLVTLDEPKGNAQSFGFATAGWTAAPAVGRLVERIGPLLGVEPAGPVPGNGPGELVRLENGRLDLASF